MKIQGTQEEVPSIEFNVDTVYIRSNIQRIETEAFTGWEYDEEQYPLREYLSKMAKENDLLTAENEQLKAQTEATSADLQGFMDFYFENGGM